MKIFDISMEIHYDMPVYKGRELKRPVITTDSDFVSGSVYESRLNMNLHGGTHIDAPLHTIENGENLDNLPLEKVVTRCKVLDFENVEDKITEDHLKSKNIVQGDFVLLKTKSSFLDLEKDFIYLDKTGAQYLKEKGVKGVGIDSLGIERDQPGHPTHNTLLGSEIIILEGLRLKDIEEGEYFLVAAPIKIRGVEASPVRAILLSELKGENLK